ncbi:hypothetical protein [Phenylobacterium sp.]|uniref:hypothetical protein n=1 Tax=Phenylobacterium sp. TaxID=1871053 RepID=UPI0025E93DE9|nr:hypothetical protein [Phenylobacterium sp.]MBX3485624.1 hypothetical protein [Phenylobacterium sp.]MCW5759580.1 hypothetical protein [Phenylobacterium sp.]
MSLFDLTDADAQGLDALAAAQLRLALRFAERAEAAEDDDAACKLARTSERAARSYRQILLIKSKLRRDLDAAAHEPAAPAAPDPQAQQRINKRQRVLYEAVERLVIEDFPDDRDTAEFVLDMVHHAIDDMAREPGFADADLASQIAEVREAVGFDDAPPADRASAEPVDSS